MSKHTTGGIEVRPEMWDSPKFMLCCDAQPNLDMDRPQALPDPLSVPVESIEEARDKMQEWIGIWDLGAGNVASGFFTSLESDGTGRTIARISFNGRLWAQDGTEIVL